MRTGLTIPQPGLPIKSEIICSRSSVEGCLISTIAAMMSRLEMGDFSLMVGESTWIWGI
jgi:hypothetical protein